MTHNKIPFINIPKSARPTRGVAKRERIDGQCAEANRLRNATLLGLALDLEAQADAFESFTDSTCGRSSLQRRRARSLREAVELLGGEKAG